MKDDKTKENDPSANDARDDSPEQPGKRKVIRHMLTGGGVIGAAAAGTKWSKPVTDSVLLPAHAQSTGTPAPTPVPTPAPTTCHTPAPTCSSTSTCPPTRPPVPCVTTQPAAPA